MPASRWTFHSFTMFLEILQTEVTSLSTKIELGAGVTSWIHIDDQCLTFAVKFTYHFKWQKPDELIKWIRPGHWHVVNVTQLKNNLAPLSNLRWKNQLKNMRNAKHFSSTRIYSITPACFKLTFGRNVKTSPFDISRAEHRIWMQIWSESLD